MQFPYAEIPEITPLNIYFVLLFVIEPNLNEFNNAIGLAPIAKISLTIPPTPVAAPSNGSIAEG